MKRVMSMQHDDLVYLGHMLERAIRTGQYLQGVSKAEFDEHEVLRLAVRQLIQTIGESARHVSLEFQARHPEIAWRAMVGMRHRIVHDYLNVDDNLLWNVAMHDLPQLIDLLDLLVPPRYRLPAD
ncbi:MAG TPA: HepT-like ribonuclease domain-containing protein [bacterium]